METSFSLRVPEYCYDTKLKDLPKELEDIYFYFDTDVEVNLIKIGLNQMVCLTVTEDYNIYHLNEEDHGHVIDLLNYFIKNRIPFVCDKELFDGYDYHDEGREVIYGFFENNHFKTIHFLPTFFSSRLSTVIDIIKEKGLASIENAVYTYEHINFNIQEQVESYKKYLTQVLVGIDNYKDSYEHYPITYPDLHPSSKNPFLS